MKTANVSTLKARLSRYLDAVRRGETVEILDRKTPIARLVPIEPSTRPRRGDIPPWLLELERQGKVTIGRMQGAAEILKRPLKGPPYAGVLDALLEERRTGR